MAAYERFAAFYDVVMDDPAPRAARVDAAIDRLPSRSRRRCSNSGAARGRSWPGWRPRPTLTGLDRSPEMLAIAAAKVPGAQLVEGDMADFDLGRRFDVVACVFDSINHLLDVASWASLLACVHAPPGRRRAVRVRRQHRGRAPPARRGAALGLRLRGRHGHHRRLRSRSTRPDLGVTDWDIRIFEQVADTRYELHHEQIGELGLPLERGAGARGRPLRAARGGRRGRPARRPTTSVKAYYALRRKG